MAKINEKKKINKEKLTEKRMELEKQLKEKLDIGKEKVIDETELMDLLNLMAEIDKTKTTPFIRFLRILKKVFLSTMVHILANSLVMALFSFNLVLENRLMLIPIIIGLSLIFMIGDNIFGLFKLKNIKRKILLYCLYRKTKNEVSTGIIKFFIGSVILNFCVISFKREIVFWSYYGILKKDRKSVV